MARANMARLTARQGERLLEGVSRMYALVPVDAFPAAVLSVIPDLIGCDSASFNDLELSTGRFRVLARPADDDPELERAFARFVHQHPVIAHFGTQRVTPSPMPSPTSSTRSSSGDWASTATSSPTSGSTTSSPHLCWRWTAVRSSAWP